MQYWCSFSWTSFPLAGQAPVASLAECFPACLPCARIAAGVGLLRMMEPALSAPAATALARVMSPLSSPHAEGFKEHENSSRT